MPLGSNVSANISELTHHGKRKRSHKQIVAIAMNAAHKAMMGGDKEPDKKDKKEKKEKKKGERE